MNLVILVIVVITTLVDLTPFIFNFRLIHNEDASLVDVVHTSQSLVCLMCLSAAATPLLVDVLCYVLHRDRFFLVERIILLIGCLMPIVIAWSRFADDRRQSADIFVCMLSIQTSWMSGALVNGLMQSNSKFFSPTLCNTVFLLGASAMALGPFWELKGRLGGAIFIAFYALYGVTLCMMFGMFIGYVREVWVGSSELSMENKSNEYLPLICCIVLIIYTLAYCILVAVCDISYMQDINQFEFDFLVCLGVIVAILATLLPGRIARSQIYKAESDLESKRSFVRYIGHELRTPLNIASIGLDLLASMDFLKFAEDTVNTYSTTLQTLHCDYFSSSELLVDDELRTYEASILQMRLGNDAQTKLSNDTTSDAEGPTSGGSHISEAGGAVRANIRVSAASSSSKPILDAEEANKMIARQKGTIKDIENILNEIRNAVNLGTKILNDLLAYDTLDSNSMMLEKKAIDVEDLAVSTLGMFVSKATAKEVVFDVEVGL
jgi:signal transduction histidine kinase